MQLPIPIFVSSGATIFHYTENGLCGALRRTHIDMGWGKIGLRREPETCFPV